MSSQQYEEVHGHRVAKENIANLDVEELLGDASPIDILYCDPPWRSTMGLFASMRERQTGKPSDNISYGELLTVFYNIIREHVDGHVFMWGNVGDEKLLQMMNAACHHVKTWTCINEQSGNECLAVYGATSAEHDFSEDLDGFGLAPVRSLVLDVIAAPEKTIFDPTCGQGGTARRAIEHDCTFYGNEWNETRADETIALIKSKYD